MQGNWSFNPIIETVVNIAVRDFRKKRVNYSHAEHQDWFDDDGEPKSI